MNNDKSVLLQLLAKLAEMNADDRIEDYQAVADRARMVCSNFPIIDFDKNKVKIDDRGLIRHRPPDVFLSHDHRDKRFIRSLAPKLQNAGTRV